MMGLLFRDNENKMERSIFQVVRDIREGIKNETEEDYDFEDEPIAPEFVYKAIDKAKIWVQTLKQKRSQ